MTIYNLYTVGYGGRSVADLVELLKSKGVTTLVDTRLSANSRDPQWRKDSLRDFVKSEGLGYWHINELGNSNYKEQLGPDVILNAPEQGLEKLTRLFLELKTPALFCVCRGWDLCHNKVVVETLIREYNHLNVAVERID